MAITINVKGVDKTSYLAKNTLRIVKSIGNKNLLTCAFNCQFSDWYPEVGHDITVYDGVTLLFGGVISRLHGTGEDQILTSDGFVTLHISSNGYEAICARRTTTSYYNNVSAGYIFEDFVDNILNSATADENITKGSITAGNTFEKYSAVCKTVKEVFDDLAKQSGVQWYIDDSKSINFISETIVTTAAYTIDQSGSFTNWQIIGYESDLENYCNKVFIRGINDGIYTYVEDTAEISNRQTTEGTAYSSGVYGKVIDAENLVSLTAMTTIGDNELKKYGFSPSVLRVRTFTSVWTVGEKVQCYMPKYAVNSNTDYLIDELMIWRYDTDILAYDMRLVKRKSADFSTQKQDKGKEYFEGLLNLKNGSNIGSTGLAQNKQATITATATITTAETEIVNSSFTLDYASDIHMTFSAYVEATASITLTAKSKLLEGSVTSTKTFQPTETFSSNATFTYCEHFESVSAGSTEISVHMQSDTGTVTINSGFCAMNLIIFPNEVAADVVTTSVFYIYGGSDGSYIQDTDEYDPDTWTSKTNMPAPARGRIAAFTVDDKGYIVCGQTAAGKIQDTDEYDPDTWTSKTDCPLPARRNPTGGTISDKGYAIAGQDGTGYIQDTDEYDPDTWTNKTNMPAPARDLAEAASNNDKIYVFGGDTAAGKIQDTDEYDPDTWTSKTDCPLPARAEIATMYISSNMYIAAGYDGGSMLQDTDEYNVGSGSWTNKTNCPAPARTNLAGLSADNIGYITGGWDGSRIQDTDQYDPDTWTSKTNMPAPGRDRVRGSAI